MAAVCIAQCMAGLARALVLPAACAVASGGAARAPVGLRGRAGIPLRARLVSQGVGVLSRFRHSNEAVVAVRLFSARLMLLLRACTLRRAVISRALLSLLNQMRFAVLALAGAASAAAFAPSSVSPLRGSKSLCMSAQAAPPAKLEHPKAKVEAEAVNAKQWGTQTLSKPAVNHPSTGTGSEAHPTARSKHACIDQSKPNPKP